MGDRCGAFPDPYLLAAVEWPWLTSCDREPGHPPPHQAERPEQLEFWHEGRLLTRPGQIRVYSWRDPQELVRGLPDGVRVRVERVAEPWRRRELAGVVFAMLLGVGHAVLDRWRDRRLT